MLAGSSAAGPGQVVLVVATISDASNGDTSTVDALLASPGWDGVSLREAIEATNSDPGTWAIRFASALRGKTIALRSALPPLGGGGVAISGDVDGDAKPDITLLGSDESPVGILVESSRNRLHGLELAGFRNGAVVLQPAVAAGRVATGETYAGNLISSLVIRGSRAAGILLDPTALGLCRAPCRAANAWKGTTITRNTVESHQGAIAFFVAGTGDRVEGASITDNTIRILGQASGPGIMLSIGGESDGARISNVTVAHNSIQGSPDIGIMVAAGADRARAGVVERVRILDNRLRLVKRGAYFCCQGIDVHAGTDSAELERQPPARWLDDNLVRDVVVRGNSIGGTLTWGVQVTGSFGSGSRRNRVLDVRVERNVVGSATVATGVYVVVGSGQPDRYATGNRALGLDISGNRITIGRARGDGSPIPAGVALQAGDEFGRRNWIRNVRITRNRIATTWPAIALVGGRNPTSRGNAVSCVRISGNVITGTRESISITPNLRGASGNRATLSGC